MTDHITPAIEKKPQNPLTDAHLRILAARAIDPDLAVLAGIRSVRVRDLIGSYDGLPDWTESGLAIPYPACVDGLHRVRVRMDATERGGTTGPDGEAHGMTPCPRYLTQAGIQVAPYLGPGLHAADSPARTDTTVPIFVVEAPLKALSLASHWLHAIGLGGVLAGAHDATELKTHDNLLAHEELTSRVRWTGRRVYVAFDAGAWDGERQANPMVAMGLARTARVLLDRGADVYLVRVPYAHPEDSDPVMGKFSWATDQGPDDYIAREGWAAFTALVDAAVPADPAKWVAGKTKTEVLDLLGRAEFQASLAVLSPAQLEAFCLVAGVGKRAVAGAVRGHQDAVAKRSQTDGDGLDGTDLRNAERFAEEHRGRAVFVPRWGKWCVWDGARWRDDDGRVGVLGLAKSTVQGIEEEGWRTGAASRASIEAMLALAVAEPMMSCDHDKFDADPWVLNVANGTLDLKTGLLRSHNPNDHLRMMAPTVYDLEAKAPRWERFLAEITAGNAEVAGYLQRFAGYCLTGVTTEHMLLFATGSGRNGKGTFLRALMHVLGDYACAARQELILDSQTDQHPTNIAAMFRKRLVAVSEVDQGRQWAEARVKEITGGDMLSCRRMREDEWAFQPTHKLFVSGNHRPQVRGVDDGIWSRIKLVGFDVNFQKLGTMDTGLDATLRDEASGILNWMVEGCLAWQRDGLREPACVTRAVEVYRTESDILHDFFEDKCELGDPSDTAFRVKRSTLRAAYESWCEATGSTPMKPRTFTAALRERGMVEVSGVKGHGGSGAPERGWAGIRLAVFADPSLDDPIPGVDGPVDTLVDSRHISTISAQRDLISSPIERKEANKYSSIGVMPEKCLLVSTGPQSVYRPPSDPGGTHRLMTLGDLIDADRDATSRGNPLRIDYQGLAAASEDSVALDKFVQATRVANRWPYSAR